MADGCGRGGLVWFLGHELIDKAAKTLQSWKVKNNKMQLQFGIVNIKQTASPIQEFRILLQCLSSFTLKDGR